MAEERSVHASHVSAFRLMDGEWEKLSEAWTEMHLFRAAQPERFRVVAWVPATHDVVLNERIGLSTAWILSGSGSEFVEFQNEGRAVYGLYFRDASSATNTTNVVLATIEHLRLAAEEAKAAAIGAGVTSAASAATPAGQGRAGGGAGGGAPPQQQLVQDVPRDFMPPPAPRPPGAGSGRSTGRMSLANFAVVEEVVLQATHTGDGAASHTSMEDAVASQIAAIHSSGEATPATAEADDDAEALAAAPPTRMKHSQSVSGVAPPTSAGQSAPAPDEFSADAAGSDESIAMPSGFDHRVHVTFNTEQARFDGLPEEWLYLNQQFGVSLASVPKMMVDGYQSRIPAVLEMLKRHLLEGDGLQVVGIFRLAPDKDDCEHIKSLINRGQFEGCADVNIVANLIKVWFRELPESLYDPIPEETIVRVADGSPTDVQRGIESFEEPNASLIEWLMDVMSLVVMNESVNKMSAKNMAIVMSPNLFSVSSENPMVALTMSQKVAEFTTKLLQHRLQTVHNYHAPVSG